MYVTTSNSCFQRCMRAAFFGISLLFHMCKIIHCTVTVVALGGSDAQRLAREAAEAIRHCILIMAKPAVLVVGT